MSKRTTGSTTGSGISKKTPAVMARPEISQINMKTPVKIGFIALGVNVTLNLILMWFIQERGLALSTAISSFVNLILLIVFLMKKKTGIIIDEEWFFSLTQFTKNKIVSKLGFNFKLEKINIPHEISEDTDIMKPLNQIHQSYVDSFDYHLWYNVNITNGPRDVEIINIHGQGFKLYTHKPLK